MHNLILSKKWILIFIILRLKRAKVIYHEHGTCWANPIKNQKIYNRRINKVDRIIVNSLATKKLLYKFYDVRNKVKVLHSPIFLYEIPDNRKLKIKKIDKDGFITLGFIGRLEIHKNPEFLIDLAIKLKEKYKIRTKIEYIGSGINRDNLEEKCLKTDVNTTFHGRVDSRNEIIERWDFCLVPSLREPMGLVPGEMALMNTLVLSSKIDGLQEMYPKACSKLLIKMVKKDRHDFENIQYMPDLDIFTKGLIPSVNYCAKIINFYINNEKKYKDVLNKHKIYIEKNFNMSKHSDSLFNFCEDIKKH